MDLSMKPKPPVPFFNSHVKRLRKKYNLDPYTRRQRLTINGSCAIVKPEPALSNYTNGDINYENVNGESSTYEEEFMQEESLPQLDDSVDICLEAIGERLTQLHDSIEQLPLRIVSGIQSVIETEVSRQFDSLFNRISKQMNPSNSHPINIATAFPAQGKPITTLVTPPQTPMIKLEPKLITTTQTGFPFPIATPTSATLALPKPPQFIQAPVQIRIDDLEPDCYVHRTKILDMSPPVDIFTLSHDITYRMYIKYKSASIFVQALFVLHFGSYHCMHLNTSSRAKNNLELISDEFLTELKELVDRWFPLSADLEVGKCLNQKQRSLLSAARSCLFFKKCDACKQRDIEHLPSTFMAAPPILR